jgi:hypothetical protein
MARNPKTKPMVVDRKKQRWAVTDLPDGGWRFGIDVGSWDLTRLTRLSSDAGPESSGPLLNHIKQSVGDGVAIQMRPLAEGQSSFEVDRSS